MAEQITAYKIVLDSSNSIKSIDDLIKRQKALKKEILEFEDVGSDAFENLKEQYKTNQRAVVEFRRELNNSKPIAERFAEGLNASFAALGTQIIAAFSINSIKNFLKELTKFTSEFNAGFARVNTVAQLSDKGLKDLQERAVSLGTTGATALNEIPNVLFDIVSATGDTEQSLDILETSLKATDAGFGDFQATAAAGTNIFNAVKEQVSGVNEVFNVLFATQKEGVLTFDDLSRVIPNIIPAAKSVGFQFNETSAALAALTKQGIGVNEASTALRAFFSSLGNGEKLDRFNEALGRVDKSVFDAEGNLRPLVDIISDFGTVVDSAANAEEKSEIFSRLKFDQNSNKALISLVDGLKDFQSVNENIAASSDGVGELQRQYELSANGARDLGIANNELQAQLLELGQKVTPSVTEAKLLLVNALVALVSGFNNFTDFLNRNKAVLAAFKVVVVALSVAIGQTLFSAISKMPALIGLMSTASKGLSAVWANLTNIFRANPLGLLVTAAFAAYEVFKLLNEESAALAVTQEQMTKAVNNATAEFAREQTFIRGIFTALQDENVVREDKLKLIEQLNNKYPDLINLTEDDIGNQEKLKKAYDELNDAIIENIVQRVAQESIQDTVQQIFNLTNEIERLKNGSEELGTFDRVVQFGKDAATFGATAALSLNDINTTLSEIGERQETIDALKENIGSVEDTVRAALNNLKDLDIAGIFQSEDAVVNVKPVVDSDDEKAAKAAAKTLKDAYKTAIDEVISARDLSIANAEQDFLKSDQAIEAQKRYAFAIESAKLDAITKFQTIDEKFNEDTIIRENELSTQKIEATNEREKTIFEINKKAKEEAEKLEEERINRQLLLLKSQTESLQRELQILDTEIERDKDKLIKAGVDIAEFRARKENEIISKFSIDQIKLIEQRENTKAQVEFNASEKSKSDKEKLEAQKIKIAISSAEKQIEILEALGTAEQGQLEDLRQKIAELKGDLANLGESGKFFTGEFEEDFARVADVVGRVGNAFGSLIDSSIQGAINRVDQSINMVTDNLSNLREEEERLQGEIENASITQENALQRQRDNLKGRIKEEEALLLGLESKKEALRKKEAANEKRLAILNATVAGAVAVVKALPNLVLAGIVGATTLAQIAVIASQKYKYGGPILPVFDEAIGGFKYADGGSIFPAKKGGIIKGPSHNRGGVKFRVKGERTIREAEGGEFINSRISTSMFAPVFDYLNNFANGFKGGSAPSSYFRSPTPSRYYADGGFLGDSEMTNSDAQIISLLQDNLEANERNRTVQFSLVEFQDSYTEYLSIENDTDDQ